MRFRVIVDREFGFIVADASVRAYSFALVPMAHRFNFTDRAEAQTQAEKLTALGGKIECRMIETPERFEEVADVKYGPAWA